MEYLIGFQNTQKAMRVVYGEGYPWTEKIMKSQNVDLERQQYFIRLPMKNIEEKHVIISRSRGSTCQGVGVCDTNVVKEVVVN